MALRLGSLMVLSKIPNPLIWGQSTHRLLIKSQSTEELERKALKARTKHYWTQEDIDIADRKASELYEGLCFE